jgi:hypothetical protein
MIDNFLTQDEVDWFNFNTNGVWSIQLTKDTVKNILKSKVI